MFVVLSSWIVASYADVLPISRTIYNYVVQLTKQNQSYLDSFLLHKHNFHFNEFVNETKHGVPAKQL